MLRPRGALSCCHSSPSIHMPSMPFLRSSESGLGPSQIAFRCYPIHCACLFLQSGSAKFTIRRHLYRYSNSHSGAKSQFKRVRKSGDKYFSPT